ncbi:MULTISPECIES: alpha/beta fold hydrolase [Cyanophyceae]|uniref:Alpha/beta fold hydrolase n=1 Tax=Leptolyngbya subtilissima DQ-A4 TaxID=2933933 RepID=A0ABV0K1Q6_9CYAN|nr:alpha/beta fold hydrolase [Nodosilinea sp. FACHB-141]MBD2111202.1 alpha/beta fold hydrolase [Nodosilinea sp. FACHB-141]
MVAELVSLSLASIEKHTWTWRGYAIAYTVAGEGTPIVLIHGFGASLGHWRKNIPALATAGHRVYAIDLLGFGDSDQPEIPYTLDLWQDLLADFWAEFIRTPAVYVGNSIGGLLTLMMLANHPDKARAGAVLNCAGGLNHRPEELYPPLNWVMGAFTWLVSSPRVGPLVFNQVRRKGRIRNSLKQVYRNSAAITDELIEMIYTPACKPTAQKVFAAIVTAPPGPKPEELLPKIAQPLLVLWGENDPWTPIKGAEVYRRLAEDVARPSLVTFHGIADTGHCPHDERPEVVNPLLLNWLNTLPKG